MTAKDFNRQYELVSISNMAKDKLSAKQNYVDGKAAGDKLTDDGRKIYKTNFSVTSKETGNPISNATVSMLEAVDVKRLTAYEATGTVTIVHWGEKNNASITVDGVQIEGSANLTAK